MNSQITIRLPSQLHKKVAGLAKKLSLKQSDIVRMAIERLVSNPPLRESLETFQVGEAEAKYKTSRPLDELVRSIEKVRQNYSLSVGKSDDLDEYLREDRRR
jgi:predicted transcriptional regulator